MFEHLLIPLDGSPLAEVVVPCAVSLAGRMAAAVTLLHIIERSPPSTIHGARHLSSPAEAEAYLRDAARRLAPEGVAVGHHVHLDAEEAVARSITAHGEELGADLIVLCTHGRGGLRHRLFGTVAQRVVALGQIPVLLVPPGAVATHFECRRVLVPLDRRPEHERALPTAVGFARALGASLRVLAVVPTYRTLRGEQARAGRLQPATTAALLELEEGEAEDYVQGELAKLETGGLRVDLTVARGKPESVIVETAERMKADLIVLGSHGRTGLDAFWSRSVAPKVAERAPIPLLLVPLPRGGT